MPITMATARRTPKTTHQCVPKTHTQRYKSSLDGRAAAVEANAEFGIYRADYNDKTGLLRAYARGKRAIVAFHPILNRTDYDHGLTVANILVGLGFFHASGDAKMTVVDTFTDFHILKPSNSGAMVIMGKRR